jgi:hypothetical protein
MPDGGAAGESGAEQAAVQLLRGAARRDARLGVKEAAELVVDKHGLGEGFVGMCELLLGWPVKP